METTTPIFKCEFKIRYHNKQKRTVFSRTILKNIRGQGLVEIKRLSIDVVEMLSYQCLNNINRVFTEKQTLFSFSQIGKVSRESYARPLHKEC